VRPGGHPLDDELFSLAALNVQRSRARRRLRRGGDRDRDRAALRSDVTVSDKSELMLAEARANVAAAGMSDRIKVEWGDIVSLPYEDDTFDVSIIEAVTMFVDPPRRSAWCGPAPVGGRTGALHERERADDRLEAVTPCALEEHLPVRGTSVEADGHIIGWRRISSASRFGLSRQQNRGEIRPPGFDDAHDLADRGPANRRTSSRPR